MKRLKFYSCPGCGNAVWNTGEAEISCCGRKLEPLVAKPVDEAHTMKIEEIEEDYYITFSHEMSKVHHVSFIAYVAYDRVLIVKLYPEQAPEVRIPKMRRGKLYMYCSQHGLWVKEQ